MTEYVCMSKYTPPLQTSTHSSLNVALPAMRSIVINHESIFKWPITKEEVNIELFTDMKMGLSHLRLVI